MASSFRVTYPPVPFRAVRFVFAMKAKKGGPNESVRTLKPHVSATHLAGVPCSSERQQKRPPGEGEDVLATRVAGGTSLGSTERVEIIYCATCALRSKDGHRKLY